MKNKLSTWVLHHLSESILHDWVDGGYGDTVPESFNRFFDDAWRVLILSKVCDINSYIIEDVLKLIITIKLKHFLNNIMSKFCERNLVHTILARFQYFVSNVDIIAVCAHHRL